MYERILERIFLGNRISGYLIASIALLASFFIINIVIRYFIKRLKKISEKTATTVDDFLVSVLEKLAIPFLYLLVIYISIKSLSFHPYFEKGMNYFELAVVMYFLARFVIMLVGYSFKTYLAKSGYDVSLERSLQGITVVIKILVWGGAVIFILDNF